MVYIFILRHGPTDNNVLNVKKFKKMKKNIIDTIKFHGNVKKIYTSPYSRTRETVELLIDDLKVETYNIKKIYNRCEKLEYDDACNNRAWAAGYSLRKKKENILIVTHSSIIRKLLEGISKKKISRFYIKQAALFIYDTNAHDFILFNK
jgi:broad specificity phosphatase PhoE